MKGKAQAIQGSTRGGNFIAGISGKKQQTFDHRTLLVSLKSRAFGAADINVPPKRARPLKKNCRSRKGSGW